MQGDESREAGVPDEVGSWGRVDALFREALELDRSEWPAFLDRVGTVEPGLRDRLVRLLEADTRGSGFLEGSVGQAVPDAVVDAVVWATGEGDEESEFVRAGERVGAWTLLRPLGRGGMASVFLAERTDGAFSRTVAVKLIRRGLDSDDFVRRFIAERQILSSLEHPNIARLIDGGTIPDGRPYLVLEFVDGVTLDEHCERDRAPVEEQLRLFLEVAGAVQYAHGRLVVHRDLKPSNVLVSADGNVKLLDFGIAKLLDPDADPALAGLTRPGLRPVTPEYASPEQLRGEEVTVASDVYQLGVLLYRLLTGLRPYGSPESGRSLEESVLHASPLPPSEAVRRAGPEVAELRGTTRERLARRLRGDLDLIVLKALRKEPGDRYGSVVEMATDIRNHLEGRPVQAHRESRVYRVRKFLQRNRWAPPTAAVLTLLVGLYVATLILHARRLEEERNVAQEVQRAFVSFFTPPEAEGDMGLGDGRRELTVRDAIVEGSDRVRADLADQPAALAQLLTAMAGVLTDLDEGGPAAELAQEALSLNTRLYGPASVPVHDVLELLVGLTAEGDSARALARRRVELARTLYGTDHPEVADALQQLGRVEMGQGNLEEGAGHLLAAIELLRPAADTDPAAARSLAWALGRAAEVQGSLGRTREALASSREAWVRMGDQLGEGHSDTAIQGVKYADALRQVGELDEAARVYRASLATLDAELGSTHGTTLSSRNNYALLLLQMDDFVGAEGVQRALLDANRARFGPRSLAVAQVTQNLALTLKEQERYVEADSLGSAAYRLYREARGDGFYQTAFPLLTLAEIRLTGGDYRGAESVAREAVRILEATLPEGHFATAVATCRLGRARAGLGDLRQGRELIEAAVRILNDVDRASNAAYREECQTALRTAGGA